MTNEEATNEVRKTLVDMLNSEGRGGAVDVALSILSRALSPDSEDFANVITEAFYTLGTSVVLRAGMSAGYAETVDMFRDLAESTIFLSYASMPAIIEAMNNARAKRGEAPVSSGNITTATLRDFAEGVKAGLTPLPDASPPLELYVMPDGLVTLHPRDTTARLPEEHWMDMSGAVPLVVKP